MIDENTPNLNLPLPAASNPLAADVERLRAALNALDPAVAGKAAAVHGHAIEDVAGLAAALLAKVEAAALAAVAFSGAYADLIGAPAVFSGDYNDLTNKPTLFSGAYSDLTGKPTLFSGAYADLTGKPALFSGAYSDLTGKPTIPTAVSQLTNDANYITSAALTGYLLASTAATTYQTKADMSGYVTTTALSAAGYASLSGAAFTGNVSTTGNLIVDGGDVVIARQSQDYGYVVRPNVAGYKKLQFAVAGGGPLENLVLNSDTTEVTGKFGVGVAVPSGKFDLSGNFVSNVVAVAASAINCSAGNYFTKTATGALTWTVTNVPASRVYSFLLELTNGGTGTQTWFSGIKWPGGTAPTLTASGVDILGFITDDGGTTWRGVQLMKDSK